MGGMEGLVRYQDRSRSPRSDIRRRGLRILISAVPVRIALRGMSEPLQKTDFGLKEAAIGNPSSPLSLEDNRTHTRRSKR